MVYKPEKDEPISELSTAATSGKSQGSRSQKKNSVAYLGCGCKERDRQFVSLLEQVGCTLIIVSNLMSEVNGKNGSKQCMNWFYCGKQEQQGLRLSEPDLSAVPEQEERIPTVPEPMAIWILKSVQRRQEELKRTDGSVCPKNKK